MMDAHYLALIPAYATATVLWFLINHFFKTPWSNVTKVNFEKPWMEFVLALMATIAILVIGQLYMRDLLIPNQVNNNYIDALNQIIIFSPAVILVLARRQSTATIWLPCTNILPRIAIGSALALCALFIYCLSREDSDGYFELLSDIYQPGNISYLVQVFMEDITIALLFVRLSAWIGRRWSIVIVALLFAAGHIPALISVGATVAELGRLFIDTSIGVLILSAVSKSRDIWWFFMVHFALDMTQFQ